MNRLCLAVGLAGVLSFPTLQAAMVTITWGSAHSGHGGEFKATPTGGWSGPAFETFCLETSENVSIGSSYYITLSDSAWRGGSGGPSPDPISKATAWLFAEFTKGTLTDNLGNRYGSGDSVKAANLQQALWWLENETYSSGPYVKAGEYLSNPYLKEVADVLGYTDDYTGLNNMRNVNADGAYGVRVMRLSADEAGTLVRQDMLVVVPEPTTVLAGALLLLPFAASTLRRSRKAS